MTTGNINEVWARDVWKKIVSKVERTSKRIGDSFPYASVNGTYNTESNDWWTNGFWPGLLWLIYKDNTHADFRDLAVSVENQMDETLLGYEKLHHDVGFMWSLTSVVQYKLLGTEASRLRGLMAASHLAGRFNLKGQFIRAWNGENQQGWAIIDCLMNLPLLYWASETTNDPRFRQSQWHTLIRYCANLSVLTARPIISSSSILKQASALRQEADKATRRIRLGLAVRQGGCTGWRSATTIRVIKDIWMRPSAWLITSLPICQQIDRHIGTFERQLSRKRPSIHLRPLVQQLDCLRSAVRFLRTRQIVTSMLLSGSY